MAQRKYQTIPKDRARIDEYVAQKGGTPAWRAAHTSLIEIVLGMAGKPLAEITTKDVYHVRNLIMDGKYSKNYKRRLVYALREFFIWHGVLTEKDKSTMKLPGMVLKTKTKKDMLTVAEVQKAIESCTHPRDRAFIAMLWDGSNRPSELLALRWDDLKADQYGYFFKTSGKTGKQRHIRLTTSIPYIEAWRQMYPGDASGDNPVFVTIRAPHRAWDIDAAQYMIRELKEKTGIKNLKPYQFRPSRITYDLRNHVDTAYVMLKNWGTLDTSMMEVYAHLDEDEDYLDQQALRAAGIKTKQKMKKEEKLEVPTCPVCESLNVIGAKFCSHCKSSMNPDDVPDIEKRFEQMRKQMEEMQNVISMIKQPSTPETDAEEKNRIKHTHE